MYNYNHQYNHDCVLVYHCYVIVCWFAFRAFKKALSTLPGANFSSSKQKPTKKFGYAVVVIIIIVVVVVVVVIVIVVVIVLV